MNNKEKSIAILRRLKKEYKVTGPFVEWSNPLELLVGTILSAQCTDERVNKVTKILFKKYHTAEDYANAEIEELEKEIFSTGFYKSKAKALQTTGQIMMQNFEGKVPDNLSDLLTLRGVSHKTAYIVLAKIFQKNDGLPVDTHVFRLTKRMGLSNAETPERMSEELSTVIAPKDYMAWNEHLITHGRAVCGRVPHCGACVISDICSKNF